ncbi:MAG: peptidylprolyl isomerase, partial [Chloracidobacterium sp.]|nr:peptidylprolyl isomerase [Chloracidobacterium sp.]
DLAKLAAQFSEDRTTKEKGGLYTDVSANEAWAEVVAALSGLKEGEIAPRVIESHAGFHIAKLEKRKTVRNSDGSETETVDFRHVLLQRKFPDPQHDNPEIPAPFISAEEIAEKMVEMEKRDRFVAEIVARNPIELPVDV